MLKNISFKYIILVFLLLLITSCTSLRFAKVTLQVVDEEGVPVQGATAFVYWDVKDGTVTSEAITDENGEHTVSMRNSYGRIGYGAKKFGYYDTRHKYIFKEFTARGWQPWNLKLKVVIRKIGNQVPMYARNTKFSILEVPVVGEKIGFDLIVFDWVLPYGKGVVPDFIFEVHRSFQDTLLYSEEVTLTFSNKEDGVIQYSEELLQGSSFKLPRFAPLTGYKGIVVSNSGRNASGYYEGFSYNDSYIFRVRSETDAKGNLKALYGKIQGPIVVTGIMKDKPKLVFKYYLNPDGTNNLEYDPTKNLFVDLPQRERVGI